MRTTLTIDDDNAVRLERLRRMRDSGLKEIVNDAIRLGLSVLEAPAEKSESFHTEPVDLGALLFPTVKDALRALDDEHDRKKLAP